jgi:hypothetical protein
MAQSKKGLVSFEAFVGVAVGLLMGLLPMTPFLYFPLSLVFLGIVGRLGWHFASVRGVSKISRKAAVCAGVVAVSTCVLAWGAYARFGSAADHPTATAITTTITGNSNIVTGPVSGGSQVAGIINNFFGPQNPDDTSFSEDTVAPPIISVGCMHFAPMAELLAGIKSGRPTPFFWTSGGRTGPEIQPLFSPYMKNGFLTADVVLLAPNRLYQVLSITDSKFNLVAPDWDVNANSRALEVVDERGTPIFQLVRVSKSHLRIDGMFGTPNGIWLLGRNGLTIQMIQGQEAAHYVAPPDFLPKMFLYPSWQHPSEAISPQPSRPNCPDKGIMGMGGGVSLR